MIWLLFIIGIKLHMGPGYFLIWLAAAVYRYCVDSD